MITSAQPPPSEQPGQDSWGLQPLVSVTGACRSLQGAGQMALDGPSGDIFPRERQKLNAEKGSRGRAPRCVWVLRFWGRTSSSLATHGGCCSLAKNNTADEIQFGRALSVQAGFSVHGITRESLPDMWMYVFGNSADFAQIFSFLNVGQGGGGVERWREVQ